MKTTIEKQLIEFNNNEYHKIFSNFLVRIKITHIIAIFVLIINALFFTDNTISKMVQLILAFIVILHDFDDSYLKRSLSKNIHQLNHSNRNLEQININLKEIASVDFLTNIPNRRFFFDIGEKEYHLANRYKQDLSLLFLDIDFFKKINDNYGHNIGDEILKIVAKTITDSTRKSDIHARVGGEEFSILLVNTDINGAKIFAEKLRQSMENICFKNENDDIGITTSIGISKLTAKDKSIYDIFKRADEALYVAKENGRNQVSINV